MSESLRRARAAEWSAGFAAHPLAWPIAPFAARFAELATFPEVAFIQASLPEAGVRFEESRPRSRSRRAAEPPGYDTRIHLDGVVPTRPESWHDVMNALVWAAFPRAKRALHARQYSVVERDRQGFASDEPRARSREGDALALVDEGGAVVAVREAALRAMEEALAARDEAAVLASFSGGDARLVLFGHALFEHLALGRPGVRASAVPLVVSDPTGLDAALVAEVDEALAGFLGTLTRPEQLRSLHLESFAAPK